MQLLTILFNLKSSQFESSVISTPSGLNRLVDLLTADESVCEESVRNEIILLLTGMAEASEIVRKLVAFSEGEISHVTSVLSSFYCPIQHSNPPPNAARALPPQDSTGCSPSSR